MSNKAIIAVILEKLRVINKHDLHKADDFYIKITTDIASKAA